MSTKKKKAKAKAPKKTFAPMPKGKTKPAGKKAAGTKAAKKPAKKPSKKQPAPAAPVPEAAANGAGRKALPETELRKMFATRILPRCMNRLNAMRKEQGEPGKPMSQGHLVEWLIDSMWVKTGHSADEQPAAEEAQK